jgi:predicted Zn finger-like uncharacterized protein
MAEPFVTRCPHCQTTLRLKDDGMVGKRVRCPRCSETFVVPPAGTTPGPSPVRTEPVPAPVAPRPAPRPAPKGEERQDEDDLPRPPARAARPREEDEGEEAPRPSRKSSTSNPSTLIIGAIVGVAVFLYFVLILAFRFHLLGADPPKPHTLPTPEKRADLTTGPSGQDPVRAPFGRNRG